MSNGTLINTNTMLAVVEKMPTAYDVEKVIAQLEEEKFGRCDDSKRVLGYAQEYVRKGGVQWHLKRVRKNL